MACLAAYLHVQTPNMTAQNPYNQPVINTQTIPANQLFETRTQTESEYQQSQTF